MKKFLLRMKPVMRFLHPLDLKKTKTTSTTRWWDTPTAIILVLALMTTATRLWATNWVDNLFIIQNITLFGILLGFLLGKSRFSTKVSFLFFAFAYGIPIIFWQIGNTFNNSELWLEKLITYNERINLIFIQFLNNEPILDSLLFLSITSIIFWLLSVSAGFVFVRYGNAWGAVIPAGITIITIQIFDSSIQSRIWYLATYIFFSLLVISRMNFLKKQSQWTDKQITLPPQLHSNYFKFTSIILAAIVFIAWTIPALAKSISTIHNIWQPYRNNVYEKNERLKNIFASLNTTGIYKSIYFSDTILLGEKVPDSNEIIFTASPEKITPNIRIYWRAHSYDKYEDGEWYNTIGKTEEYSPDVYPKEPIINNVRVINSFHVYGNVPLTTLFLPPEPLWINQKGMINLSGYPDGTKDVISFSSQPFLKPGETYLVYSSLEHASIEDLRQAGKEYPIWIRENYLKLPDNLSERFITLAKTITRDKDTPYDKAAAITSFLRQNISYSNNIISTPKNAEPIDWFLFEYKKGFCNYYATAEVLLLRSIGIPAKFSLGYSEGERNNNTYTVRQRNAHAWAEVFFPGIGWVIFEPTASQPQITRAINPTLQSQPFDDESIIALEKRNLDKEIRSNIELSNGSSIKQRNSFLSIITSILTFVGIIVIFIFAIVQFRNRINLISLPIILENSFIKIGITTPKMISNWAAIARLSPTKKAYLQINYALERQGYQSKPCETPTERAEQLRKLIPATNKYLSLLIREYQKETYYNHQAYTAQAIYAGDKIKQLSRKTFFAKIPAFMESFRKTRIARKPPSN